MSAIEIVASVFRGAGREGDFAWMIRQPAYDDAFFIFNDNEQQFRRHRDDPADPLGCAAGGGNATIRPWQCATPPRAGGIPTGPGFASLTPRVRALVDEAIAAIGDAVAAHGYRRIFFSSDGQGGLGTSIFAVPEEVKAYIVQQIHALAG